MAEVERPVMVVTTVAMATIKQERTAEENTSQPLHYALHAWMKRMCNTVNSFLAGHAITLRALWKVSAQPQGRAAAVKSATCHFVVIFHIKVLGGSAAAGSCAVCEMTQSVEHWVWNDHPVSAAALINTGGVPHCSVASLHSDIWICHMRAVFVTSEKNIGCVSNRLLAVWLASIIEQQEGKTDH